MRADLSFGHSSPFAFSTDTFALGDLTALHEIGHVMNGEHENLTQPPQACGLSDPSYACGLVHSYIPSPACAWQTMMGGYVDCAFNFSEEDSGQQSPFGQSTPRIARWSNPDVFYGLYRTGSASRDMAAALDINMPKASAWMPDPVPPSSAPASLTVNSFQCYGFNSASWSSVSGATEYRLYNTGGWTPVLLYSGPNTIADFNVNSSTPVNVMACNAGGCSGWSPTANAQFYSGCL